MNEIDWDSYIIQKYDRVIETKAAGFTWHLNASILLYCIYNNIQIVLTIMHFLSDMRHLILPYEYEKVFPSF